MRASDLERHSFAYFSYAAATLLSGINKRKSLKVLKPQGLKGKTH